MGNVTSQVKMERSAGAYGHPVRGKLLNLLVTRPGATAAQLASWSGVPIQSVRRHLKGLVDADLVVIERQEARRGVLRNHYMADVHQYFTSEDCEQVSERSMLRSMLGTLRLIFDAATEAVSSRSYMAREEWVLGNVQGEVDERGWQELASLHMELLEQSKVVFEESRKRLRAGSATPIHVLSGQLCLERRPLDHPTDASDHPTDDSEVGGDPLTFTPPLTESRTRA